MQKAGVLVRIWSVPVSTRWWAGPYRAKSLLIGAEKKQLRPYQANEMIESACASYEKRSMIRRCREEQNARCGAPFLPRRLEHLCNS